jgi:SAM-dependent methyltransferase
MPNYDIEFYRGRDKLTRFAAETVLGIVQGVIPEIRSAIDIGCGVGTWLSVLKARGASTVLGIDGSWVHRESLVIPPECFVTLELSREDLPVDGKYDLVISLEVAEHLPAERASAFVAQLAQLGDFILFSAAIPGQGGTGHVNEQWPEYWIDRFERQGYTAFDFIRREIWTDKRIAVHYRQNIFLFVRRERVGDLRMPSASAGGPIAIVHPQLFQNVIREHANLPIRQSFGLLTRALAKRIKRDVGIAS